MNDINIVLQKCHKIFDECVSFDNIENSEFICGKLHMVKEIINELPTEKQLKINNFIDEVISPIIYDKDYFSFLKRKELGSYNDEHHFEINSEESLEMMIYLLYEHTFELKKIINNFITNLQQPILLN